MAKNNKQPVSQEVTKVAVEDGSSYIKVVWGEHPDQRARFPSLVKDTRSSSSVRPGMASSSSYGVDGREYSVEKTLASNIKPMPTNDKAYQTSAHNRAMIHHALRMVPNLAKEVRVAVTVPVGYFYDDNMLPEETFLRNKAENTKGDIVYLDDEEAFTVNRVTILPEGVAAFNHVMSKKELEGELFLVIDSGGTTCDIAVITSEGSIQVRTSIPLGSLQILEKLTARILDETPLSGLDKREAEIALETGYAAGFDVSKAVGNILGWFSNEIQKVVKDFGGELRIYDGIILTGGGAMLIKEDIFGKEIEHKVHKTDLPQFDNAYGSLLAMNSYE